MSCYLADMNSIQDIRNALAPEWDDGDAAATYAKMQDFITKCATQQRRGLMGKVNEMLAELHDGAVVAVSQPEFGDARDGVVSMSYTLKPLLAGMPVPDGWTAYQRRDNVQPWLHTTMAHEVAAGQPPADGQQQDRRDDG